MGRCSHVYRSGQLHPSIKIGGVSLGQCENECFPDLVVCLEHANKETLAMLAQQYMRRCAALEKELRDKNSEERKSPRRRTHVQQRHRPEK